LFLDRDGVINEDLGYVHLRKDFNFIEGIFDLVRVAKDAGMACVVVTNQAGIGRGYYSEQDFQELTDWMLERFREEGAGLDAVYHCPHHPEHGRGHYKVVCNHRKPGAGMILEAKRALGLDLERSVLVGDKFSDVAAARAAGVGKTFLFSTRKANQRVQSTVVMDSVAENHAETIRFLRQHVRFLGSRGSDTAI
jgi:D-glycero-D-manno-heptose 1,7-bisphosphate phosphatase